MRKDLYETGPKTIGEVCELAGISRQTFWKFRMAENYPSLLEQIRNGKLSVRKAHRLITGDNRIQLNVEVQPWVKEQIKDAASEWGMTMADVITVYALSLAENKEDVT